VVAKRGRSHSERQRIEREGIDTDSRPAAAAAAAAAAAGSASPSIGEVAAAAAVATGARMAPTTPKGKREPTRTHQRSLVQLLTRRPGGGALELNGVADRDIVFRCHRCNGAYRGNMSWGGHKAHCFRADLHNAMADMFSAFDPNAPTLSKSIKSVKAAQLKAAQLADAIAAATQKPSAAALTPGNRKRGRPSKIALAVSASIRAAAASAAAAAAASAAPAAAPAAAGSVADDDDDAPGAAAADTTDPDPQPAKKKAKTTTDKALIAPAQAIVQDIAQDAGDDKDAPPNNRAPTVGVATGDADEPQDKKGSDMGAPGRAARGDAVTEPAAALDTAMPATVSGTKSGVRDEGMDGEAAGGRRAGAAAADGDADGFQGDGGFHDSDLDTLYREISRARMADLATGFRTVARIKGELVGLTEEMATCKQAISVAEGKAMVVERENRVMTKELERIVMQMEQLERDSQAQSQKIADNETLELSLKSEARTQLDRITALQAKYDQLRDVSRGIMLNLKAVHTPRQPTPPSPPPPPSPSKSTTRQVGPHAAAAAAAAAAAQNEMPAPLSDDMDLPHPVATLAVATTTALDPPTQASPVPRHESLQVEPLQQKSLSPLVVAGTVAVAGTTGAASPLVQSSSRPHLLFDQAAPSPTAMVVRQSLPMPPGGGGAQMARPSMWAALSGGFRQMLSPQVRLAPSAAAGAPALPTLPHWVVNSCRPLTGRGSAV
jgi:hypothetical protein